MGATYKRLVKFTYYKIKLISNENGHEEVWDYDLTNWLASSHDYIEFNITEKKPLDFLQARVKMYTAYLERRKDLLKLCQR